MLVKDNPYISTQDKNFFILLRIGLWQKVEEELSSCPDWNYIYDLAIAQTVHGVIADAIGIYRKWRQIHLEPSDALKHSGTSEFISQEWNDKFLSASAQIVRRNWSVQQTQEYVSKVLSDNHIPFFIVKGLEAAKNYPKPMLRFSGDIDYAIQSHDFKKVQSIMMPLATRYDEYEELKDDQSFFYGDIQVEFHGNLHPSLGNQVNRVEDILRDEVFSSLNPETLEPETSVSYNTFCVEYILLHALQHYHWTGLGIRQITDWTMLIAKQSDNIDWTRVKSDIKEMGIQQEWNSFLSFAINYLGMEITPSIPLSTHLSPSIPSSLWETCKHDGNMGHSKEYSERIPNTLLRIVSAWIDNIHTYFRTRSVSPHLSKVLLGLKFQVYVRALKGKVKKTKERKER